ncbi:MAG: hypothetical protein IT320_19075 [Anaerolineae bacterium]|nr:hypothetical protein [Anaerolineae bacterium]
MKRVRSIITSVVRYRWLTVLLALALVLGGLTSVTAYDQQSNSDSVYKLTVSGDKSVIAVAYYEDSRVDLFDNQTGDYIRSVDPGPSVPAWIALSPNGDRLAYSASNGNLVVANTTSGSRNRLLGEGVIQIGALAWSPVRDEIAVAIGSGITVISSTTGETIHQILDPTHRGMIVGLEWSPDGQRLLSNFYTSQLILSETDKRQLQIWDLSSEEMFLSTPILTIVDRGGGGTAWSPDGTQIALTEDGSLAIFNLVTETFVAELPTNDHLLTDVAWSPDGSKLATGGQVIRIWNSADWQIAREILNDKVAVYVQWSQDGRHVSYDGLDGLHRDEALVPDSALTGTPMANLVDATPSIEGIQPPLDEMPVQPDSAIEYISWNHTGTLLAVVTDDLVTVFDGQSQQQVWEYAVDDYRPQISWNPQVPTQLAVAGYESGVEVWDVQTGALVLALETASWLQDVAYSPDGSRIATAHGLGTPDFAAMVQVWNALNGQLITETRSRSRYIASLTWSPIGDRIAGIAGDFNQAIVWNAATGEDIAAFPRYDEDNPESVWQVRWSPQGNRIVTYGDNVGFSLWDADTYELQTTFSLADSGNDMEFNTAGDLLAVAGIFSVHVIEVATGTVITEQMMPEQIESIAWHPDRNTLSVGGLVPLAEVEVDWPTPTPTPAP